MRVDGAGEAYDPLAVAGGQPRTLDLVVTDEGRGREIPAARGVAATRPRRLAASGFPGS